MKATYKLEQFAAGIVGPTGMVMPEMPHIQLMQMVLGDFTEINAVVIPTDCTPNITIPLRKEQNVLSGTGAGRKIILDTDSGAYSIIYTGTDSVPAAAIYFEGSITDDTFVGQMNKYVETLNAVATEDSLPLCNQLLKTYLAACTALSRQYRLHRDAVNSLANAKQWIDRTTEQLGGK